jgi:hypothetical protein
LSRDEDSIVRGFLREWVGKLSDPDVLEALGNAIRQFGQGGRALYVVASLVAAAGLATARSGWLELVEYNKVLGENLERTLGGLHEEGRPGQHLGVVASVLAPLNARNSDVWCGKESLGCRDAEKVLELFAKLAEPADSGRPSSGEDWLARLLVIGYTTNERIEKLVESSASSGRSKLEPCDEGAMLEGESRIHDGDFGPLLCEPNSRGSNPRLFVPSLAPSESNSGMADAIKLSRILDVVVGVLRPDCDTDNEGFRFAQAYFVSSYGALRLWRCAEPTSRLG